MKKIFTYLTIFALAALAAGCAKEMSQDEALVPVSADIDSDGTVTVQFVTPDSPETKTVLGAKDGSSYPVKWSAGDQELVSLNGSAPTASNKDSDTQITATFKPTSGLSVYNFLYRGDAGHDNQVTIPAAQSYVASGFDAAAMPMYAASASRSNTVTFIHLCALLKFSITGSKKIDSVTLTAADGSKSLSGIFAIGKTSNLLNGTLTPASGGGTINYNFGSHIQLSDTPFVFYVAIPAGTYEGGITLNIVDNEKGHMTATVMNTDATKTIAAGKVREFNNIVYVPDVEQNLHQIYSVATFQSFVTAVAGGKKTLNARITKGGDEPIDLSSIASDFASIDDYKGIFDGGGKTISGLTKPLFNDLKGVVKNLTLNSTINETDASKYNVGMFARRVVPSNEVDDIAGLQNCTASGSVTFTPSSTATSAQIGGLVGNNLGGTITGCTNNATVTFANNGSSTVHSAPASIGGVVGRTQKGGDLSTQGDISNCTNAGTVECGAKFSNNVYIGGVLGFQVDKAESISGCTNSGLVKATASCSTTGPLHIGGVIGMGRGTIESCSNLAAGTVTTEACSAGTYLCQGGVVGRINRNSDTYTGLTNAGTLNVAGVASNDALVGGIVGRCNEGASLTGMTNSGSIYYTAASGYSSFIGGIVARTTTPISDCHSTGGSITYTGTNVSNPAYVGGIVAYTNESGATVSGCTNAANIDFGGTFTPSANNYYAVGGIIGNMATDNAISSCLNTGNVTYSQQISEKGYTFVGGIAGRTEGSIESSTNGGKVSFTGACLAQSPFIGGIVGTTVSGQSISNNSNNSGEIIINTSSQTGQDFYAGGVAGRSYSISGSTNGGAITVSRLACGMLMLGGVVGLAASEGIGSGCSNLAAGDIELSNVTANGIGYIGGVVGRCYDSGEITANNAGDLTLNSSCSTTSDLFIGGIVGHSTRPISGCTNSGKVENSMAVNNGDKSLFVAGIAGWNTGNSQIKESCSNTAAITNNANSAGGIYVGGVSGYNEGWIKNATNSGPVTNNGDSGNSQALYVGGIVASAHNAINTSIRNSGTVKNTGNSADYVYVGGITGYNYNTVTADNTGNVFNSGNSDNDHPIEVGGITGKAQKALSNCSNAGQVWNNGASAEDVCLGGIAGVNEAVTFTSCSNTGKVLNRPGGTGGVISVGGLVGWSAGAAVYDGQCYNTGNVSNRATGSDTKMAARIGGLVGHIAKNSTLSSTSSSDCNYNSGAVADSSACATVAIGGICGYVNNTVVTHEVPIDNAQNRAGGNITATGIKGAVHIGGIIGRTELTNSLQACTNAGNINISDLTASTGICVGGILGSAGRAYNADESDSWAANPEFNGTDASHQTTNSGNIKFTRCTITGSEGVRAGGIIGGWDNNTTKTIQHCTNSGSITTNTQTKDSSDIDASEADSYNYFGGIAGYSPSDGQYKTFTYCHNTNGHIIVYMSGRTRVGGIAGNAGPAPTYCDVSANIIVGSTGTVSAKWAVGGIVGFKKTQANTYSFSNLYYNGTIDTHELDYSSYTHMTSGFANAGNANSVATSWTSCKLGGSIRGGDTSASSAGLFTFSQKTGNNRPTITCSSCQILTETKLIVGNTTNTITSDNPDPGLMVGGPGTKTTSISEVSCVSSITP